MIKLAIKNLLEERMRLIISMGGISLAIVLIIVINGIFVGSEEHAVAYIQNQPAEYWIMQEGVENMHMSSSILPASLVDQVQAADGVSEAVGLLYASGTVDVGKTSLYSYIFAVDDNVPFGGPWDLAKGKNNLALDEIILDEVLAKRYGLELGDSVTVFGNELKIAGLSRGTFGIATSIVFINKETLAWVMGVPPQSASYIMVVPESGVSSIALENQLIRSFPETSILSQQDFIESDKEMIRQMGADVISAMNSISYIVGILVIGLTIYTATLERAHEYGVLKAIGAKVYQLIMIVFIQAYVSAVLGIVLGVGIAVILSIVIGWIYPEMLVVIEQDYIIQQLPILFFVTGIAGMIPLRRIINLDAMTVFRE